MKKEIELKKSGKLKVIDEKDEVVKMRVITNKLKNHEFQDNEKINQIQKQNKKLMDKLYVISQGRNSSLNKLIGVSLVPIAGGGGGGGTLVNQSSMMN